MHCETPPVKWLGRPALRRDPIILILAIGAVWTTVMAANGATAVALRAQRPHRGSYGR
jgi:hypothetical protein